MLMHKYTQPGRLQLCYTFDLLSNELTPIFKKPSAKGSARGETSGAASRSPTTTLSARRVVSRQEAPEKIAPLCMAFITLRGTRIYQGEELGYTESDLPLKTSSILRLPLAGLQRP